MIKQSVRQYLRHLLIFGTPLDFYCEQASVPLEILHIGAHIGEEDEHYKDLGIKSALWVEAQPDIFIELTNNVGNSRALNAAVWSSEIEMTFNVSDNSVSSSLLSLESDHPWGELHFSEKYVLKTKTLTNVLLHFQSLGYLKEKYFLLLDVQGAEFEILNGWQGKRRNVQAISCEVSRKKGYLGAAKRWRIIIKLIAYGYIPMASFLDSETKHGDQLFVRFSVAFRNPRLVTQTIIRSLILALVKIKV